MAQRPLTRRQLDVLGRFIDLYREGGRPLHYTEVAEHVGVRPVTAYEMLRLLESRGLATSEYRLEKREGSGPGRASVYFRPTPLAHQIMRDLMAGDEGEEGPWETIKTRILERLQTRPHDELVEELLSRVDEEAGPLTYLAEMTAGILLLLEETLAGLRQDPEFRERLAALGLPGDLGVQALAGLSVGLALTGRLNRRLTTFLLLQSRRYRQHVAQLSEAECRQLNAFVQEVLQALQVADSGPK